MKGGDALSISAANDKRAVWRRIRGDPWTMDKLGIEMNDTATAAKRILKHKNSDEELTDQTFYVSIYFAPSRKCYDTAFVERIIQVDVICPESQSITADEIMDQITALLTAPDFKINGRYLLYDADVGDLAAPSGFYGIGTRYSFYTGTQTKLKIKTI